MAALRRIVNLFRKPTVNREIEEEMRAHLEMRIDANIASGMTPEEARRDALVRFGNPVVQRERVQAQDAALGMEYLWFDLRYAVRQLLKSPGFTLTAMLTLAVGIGANTAIFSSMDAVVLRPLAVPQLDRVMVVSEQSRAGYEPVAQANFGDWVRQSQSFEELAAWRAAGLSMTGAGDAASVGAAVTTASFFRVLQAQPTLGRVYSDDECQPGRDAEVVLSYGFWQRQFAGSGRVLGQRVELDGRGYTIIGVLPKAVQYPPTADVFLPLAPTAAEAANRTEHGLAVIARLRAGVTVRQADAEMRALAMRLAGTYPATNQGWSAHVEPLLNQINGDLTPLYYRMLMGATLFVLLVVCANVANLQFARGIERRSEMAMRSALGASRWRIVRQLLTENVILGLGGAAGGLGFGALYLKLTLITMPERVARFLSGWSHVSLNGRAFTLSVALALAAGLLSGLTPALDALRVNLADQLKAGSRSTTGNARGRRLRSFFAVAQVALAVALVIGATLLTKGMWRMLHMGDVYQPKSMLTFDVNLPRKRFDTPRKRAEWYAESLAKLRALPGVQSAEVTTALPYDERAGVHDIAIENRPVPPGKAQDALRVTVSEGYFASLGIPILEGRGIMASDTLDTTPVAVVSRRFVEQYLPGENPLGKRIRVGGTQEEQTSWLRIVGVAEEASYSLWDPMPHAAVYLSAAQLPQGISEYALRTQGDPLALAPAARKALAQIDPALPLDTVETYDRLLKDNLTGLMYAAALLGVDAAIALLLAAVGIFGVMATLVGEQTREIGVRLAMGARREDVLRMVLGRAGRLTAVGLAVGLALAFALAHGVANLLRGVRPDDPVVFGGIALAISAIALVSSWIPARRAAHVDPIRALRSE